jgi:hypothetical protein
MDHPGEVLHTLFRNIEKRPRERFRVLMGKGDYELTPDIADQLPSNLDRLIGNNLNVHHPRMAYLPMGRDFRNKDELPDFLQPRSRKTRLCYCNFSLGMHPDRETVYRHIKEKSFVDFDHMGRFLEYPISRHEFLSKLAASKFAICPRGNALDTFRLWDCLYLGSIPVVVKEAVFHEQLTDLPILFLEHVDDYATLDEAQLENIYESFLRREFDFSKLKLNYWI